MQPSGPTCRALIFDVDGTLYNRRPVRRTMLCRMLRAYLAHPVEGLLTLRALHAYRKAQEWLRKAPPQSGDISRAQLLLASQRVGTTAESIAFWVARWMEQEPLPVLAKAMRSGTVELLQDAKGRGLRLAALSDYPAEKKLAAMGLSAFFDVVVTAQDPDVQRFKPDPKGLELALQRLAVGKNEAVYIGDRAEVDGAAASRAGIRCLILGRRQNFNDVAKLLIPQG